MNAQERAVMQQAASALESCRTGGYCDVDGDFCKTFRYNEKSVAQSLSAIRQALAAPALPLSAQVMGEEDAAIEKLIGSLGYQKNHPQWLPLFTAIKEFSAAGRAAGVEPAVPKGITIDLKQASELLEMFGGEPTEMTLLFGEGHSGRGLYASYTDMPEEGAEFLGVSDDEAVPTKAAGAAPCSRCNGRGAIDDGDPEIGEALFDCPDCVISPQPPAQPCGTEPLESEPQDGLSLTGDPQVTNIATPPFGSKRAAALALYQPPFSFLHGYIYDANHQMVSDDQGVEEHVAQRIRGWGRIGYMPNGAALQDEVGRAIADALNAFWITPPLVTPPLQREPTSETGKND